MADVEIIGLQELDAQIAKIVDTVTAKSLRKASSAGGEVFRKQVRANAPVRQEEGLKGNSFHKVRGKTVIGRPKGYLKKHIGKQVKMNYVEKSCEVYVGPMRSAFYGNFDELGTSHQSAHPFMRPAFDAKKEEVVTVFGETLTADAGLK